MSFHQLKNSEELEQLVKQYQEDPTEDLMKLVFTKISPSVSIYPQIAFRIFDEDVSADFSLYIYNRLDNILLRYQGERASFCTYLCLKLRSHFLNFLKREKNKHKKSIHSIPASNNDHLFDEITYGEDICECNEEQTTYLIDNREIKLQDIFSHFGKDKFLYLVLKLYYYDFFNIEEDLEKLERYTGKNTCALLIELEEIEEILYQIKKSKIEKEIKLTHFYTKNLREIEEIKNKKHLNFNDLLEIEEKISTKKNYIFQKYRSIKIETPLKIIAKILSVKTSKVSNVINYFKNSIKKKFTS